MSNIYCSTTPEQHEADDYYIDICNFTVSDGTGVYLNDGSTEPLRIAHTDMAERANYAVRVTGDSMMLQFCDGDIVLVETCRTVDEGEIGIFNVDGEEFIKKYGENVLFHSIQNIRLLKNYESVYCRGRVLGTADVIG